MRGLANKQFFDTETKKETFLITHSFPQKTNAAYATAMTTANWSRLCLESE